MSRVSQEDEDDLGGDYGENHGDDDEDGGGDGFGEGTLGREAQQVADRLFGIDHTQTQPNSPPSLLALLSSLSSDDGEVF